MACPNATVTAPPLGVYPGHLWTEDNPGPSEYELLQRLYAVQDAKLRYAGAGVEYPAEWDAELDELTDRIRGKN